MDPKGGSKAGRPLYWLSDTLTHSQILLYYKLFINSLACYQIFHVGTKLKKKMPQITNLFKCAVIWLLEKLVSRLSVVKDISTWHHYIFPLPHST